MIIVDRLMPESARLTQFYSLDKISSLDRRCVAMTQDRVAVGVWRPRFADCQWVGLVRRGEQAAARVVARVSPDLRDDTGRPLGMFGYFEAHEDFEAVKALFDVAVEWLRARGVTTIIGPMDGDTWHRYRFNVGPWEEPPFLMEPFQPDYYCSLWNTYGFRPVEHYYSKRVDDVAHAADQLDPVRRRVAKQGYQLRPFRPDRYEDELRLLYELSLAVFSGNYLYEPIEWEEFRRLYDPIRRLIVPQLIWFASAPNGAPAGFLFGTIDWQIAAARASRRRGVAAKFTFLWNRHRALAVNLKSLGVVTEYRRSGLGAALMCEGYRQAVQLGYRRANLCLIREGNPSGGLDGGVGVTMRRYALYQWSQANPA